MLNYKEDSFLIEASVTKSAVDIHIYIMYRVLFQRVKPFQQYTIHYLIHQYGPSCLQLYVWLTPTRTVARHCRQGASFVTWPETVLWPESAVSPAPAQLRRRLPSEINQRLVVCGVDKFRARSVLFRSVQLLFYPTSLLEAIRGSYHK